jgi:hypothetical protein
MTNDTVRTRHLAPGSWHAGDATGLPPRPLRATRGVHKGLVGGQADAVGVQHHHLDRPRLCGVDEFKDVLAGSGRRRYSFDLPGDT